ncbi:MAG: hypothetical protein JWL77_1267 [Chthonomonadaceae bacterium]|nr:hypothetical protein [Chthonomonadaceae bacterium]
MLKNDSGKKSETQKPELNPGLSADKNSPNNPEVPRFVAPTHEGVDILKLLTELEDLVEGSPKMMGALLRFDEDKFHMTIMKIRANLPEEMKRASKLARDSERIVEETRDNADRVVSEARRAALQELERGRAESTHLKEEAREESRRQNAEAQAEASRVRQNADAEARQKLAEAQRNAAELVAEAQAQAAQLVADDQIVQQALVQAQELKMRAEQEADAVRRGSDDYARDVLTNLENVLGKTVTQIQRGRDMLERK